MCYENLGIALNSWKLAHLLTLSEQTAFAKSNVFFYLVEEVPGSKRVNRWTGHQRKLRNSHLMMSLSAGPRTTCLAASRTDLLDAGAQSRRGPRCPSRWVAFSLAKCLSQ